ncbi:MAG: hypothetical protein AB8F78_17235 [Saprospiraceae bacterium]
MDFFYLRASFKPKDIGRRFPQIVSDFPGDVFLPPWLASSPQAYVEGEKKMVVKVSNSVKPTSMMSSAMIRPPWFIGNRQLLSFLDENTDYQIPRRPLTVKFKDGERKYFVFKLKEESFSDWFDSAGCEAAYHMAKFYTPPYEYESEEIPGNRIFGLRKAKSDFWQARFASNSSLKERNEAVNSMLPSDCRGGGIIISLTPKVGATLPPILNLGNQVVCTSDFTEACAELGFTGMLFNPLLGSDHSFDDDGVMIVRGSERLNT